MMVWGNILPTNSNEDARDSLYFCTIDVLKLISRRAAKTKFQLDCVVVLRLSPRTACHLLLVPLTILSLLWSYSSLFSSPACAACAGCSAAVASSFSTMRSIVTVGWSIYPLGYLFGYLLGAVDQVFLNVIYNIADFVNKIAFVLACWSAAKSDSEGKGETLLG